MYENNALPYELSPASGPSRPDNRSQRCLSLVTPILPCHHCSSMSSAQTLLHWVLNHRGLPQVSVVEKVRQLFPSTENMMTVPFPLMLWRKQPAVKSTKLRSSPDPAHNSWRASNVLCHHRQMDRSVSYTYNPPPSSQDNIRKTSFLPD